MIDHTDIYNEVVRRTRVALGLGSGNSVVTLGRPLTEQLERPSAAIIVSTSRDMTGVRFVTEVITFEIYGFFPMPGNEVLVMEQRAQVSALASELVDSSWESFGGYMPIVSGVDYGDGDITENQYTFRVTFSLMTDVDQ